MIPANARVGTWLREVANAPIHATTVEVPTVRLIHERQRLQPLPSPWSAKIERPQPKRAPLSHGYKHPLRIYEELLTVQELHDERPA